MRRSGKAIYQDLCAAGNLDTAVQDLASEDVTSVAEYLSGLKKRGGIPAQVWGLVSTRLSAETLTTAEQ